MTKTNKHGQWTLDGKEKSLIPAFKTDSVSTASVYEDLGKGDDVANKQLEKVLTGKGVMSQPRKLQPTDKELFGQFVVTEEQVAAAENKWNNTFQFYNDWNTTKRTEPLAKTEAVGWGDGKSFLDTLTEEERNERKGSV